MIICSFVQRVCVDCGFPINSSLSFLICRLLYPIRIHYTNLETKYFQNGQNWYTKSIFELIFYGGNNTTAVSGKIYISCMRQGTERKEKIRTKNALREPEWDYWNFSHISGNLWNLCNIGWTCVCIKHVVFWSDNPRAFTGGMWKYKCCVSILVRFKKYDSPMTPFIIKIYHDGIL